MPKREISIAFQTDKRAADYIALAKLVNDYAFDAVTVYCDAPYQPSFGPLLLMAPHIERARIGPAGIPPSRMHPLDIAAGTALLADVARAGTYLGLVRGGWLADHGIRELKPPLAAMRESITIIRKLLAGESAGMKGRVFQIAEHARAPYPLPGGRIPLQIGTWGKMMAALAGELADEVKIGGSANPALIPWMAEQIAQGEARAKRPPGTVKIVIGAVSVVDDDRDAARFAARKAVALYLPIVSQLDPTNPPQSPHQDGGKLSWREGEGSPEPELLERIAALVAAGDSDGAARLVPDDILDRFAFAGNAADIIQQCERLFDAGAQRIELGTPHGVADSTHGIRLIGGRVLPALASYFM